MSTDPVARAIEARADEIARSGQSKRGQFVALRAAYVEMCGLWTDRLAALEREIMEAERAERDAREAARERRRQDHMTRRA